MTMSNTKQAQAQRIAELERKLIEAESAMAYRYYHAEQGLTKASTDHLMASGVVLTLTVLGGRMLFDPVMICDGLSKETIAALKKDLLRSFERATELKPKGA